MDFRFPPEAEQLRTEVRAWCEENVGASRRRGEIPYEVEKEIRYKLAEQGWLTPSWPTEYGGTEKSFWENVVLSEELQYGGVHTGSTGVRIVGPMLMQMGNEDQKARFLPRIANGDIDFAIGYSEPDAGSDLASLRTSAIRDGDSYVVNGVKMFTSLALRAEYCLLAARTDPDAPKHRGISLFLVDMKAPGIEVAPLGTMAGHSTNMTYWKDVRIPVEDRIGDENRGWYYMTMGLDLERLGWYTPGGLQYVADDYLNYMRLDAPDEVRRDPLNREAAARVAAKAVIARLLYRRAAWLGSQGTVANYEASVSKVFTTELEQEVAREATRAMGPFGQLVKGDDYAQAGGRLAAAHLAGVVATIGGGSSEVQRNIIATRGMGLPRG